MYQLPKPLTSQKQFNSPFPNHPESMLHPTPASDSHATDYYAVNPRQRPNRDDDAHSTTSQLSRYISYHLPCCCATVTRYSGPLKQAIWRQFLSRRTTKAKSRMVHAKRKDKNHSDKTFRGTQIEGKKLKQTSMSKLLIITLEQIRALVFLLILQKSDIR